MSDEGECHHSGHPATGSRRCSEASTALDGGQRYSATEDLYRTPDAVGPRMGCPSGEGGPRASQNSARVEPHYQEKRGGATNGPAKTPPNPIASDGTCILKNWGGTAHEVLVTEDGASWNGQTYSSLSAVARAMTGTNRNGPKFFGLREGSKS